ncbi:hypothetical protein LAZ67_9000181 [Cordylochernes scorpioides]|uniref:DUF5641 domain-containing protein n=1 Tax=Cordylochernes scorpioides TaxID=51811 RepID=A0ABY6KSC3_9ARAC|nr:hypothetical protein LAZ67_9000181 [Cordylochernes scorpioides]
MFWPKGRIVELISAEDGIVRVAHVKTSTGILVRGIHPSLLKLKKVKELKLRKSLLKLEKVKDLKLRKILLKFEEIERAQVEKNPVEIEEREKAKVGKKIKVELGAKDGEIEDFLLVYMMDEMDLMYNRLYLKTISKIPSFSVPDDCPLYKFNGGISNLHSVTPEALNWLKALPLRL